MNAPPVTTTSIVLSRKTGQLAVGGTQNFRLVENLSNGKNQDQTASTIFTVSDPTIAKVQENELTAIAPGYCTGNSNLRQYVRYGNDYGECANTLHVTKFLLEYCQPYDIKPTLKYFLKDKKLIFPR
ncbi:hypothetical protein ACQKNX_15240 [Lysinibacillus sp. NPDC093712]|uniref:hypothetical protein n=1 Tax=Lysinibacillus sp. NPDC093712 TaxID=3390579 RepID=UPI003D06893B